ncbi:hypothetical protein OV079_11295 [Nannocystis pusilla]|uniref:Uncharacterized protein n=1 Tax=Nannocystis pusilla TaxID=889268 RepID=A0A9X3EMX5_9BACT|nr:hypothetical protein [Nannocystis pusilla]MCY1006135.1 hypothetical protein [Nannocystis pusilla]
MEIDELDDLAVVLGESGERGGHLVGEALGVPRGLGRAAGVDPGGVEQVLGDVAALGGDVDDALVAVPRDEGVDQDPRQPGAQAAARPEAVPVGPRLGQGLLHQVLSLAALPGEAHADAGQARQVRVDLGQELVGRGHGSHARPDEQVRVQTEKLVVARG